MGFVQQWNEGHGKPLPLAPKLVDSIALALSQWLRAREQDMPNSTPVLVKLGRLK